MVAFKAILAISSAAVALAAPSVHRSLDDGATCAYTVTPSASADGINLVEEMNYIIGSEISKESKSAIFNDGLTPELNSDGSYTASGTISVETLTADQLEALVKAWPASGKMIQGLPWNGELTWAVNAVTCD